MALPISDDAAAAQTDIPLAPLGDVLETIDQGIVLLASDSFPCYTNAAAERLLLADGERSVLTREMRSVSRTVLAQGDDKPAEVEVQTKAGRYRMRATLLLQKIREIRSRTVLVTIQHAGSELPTSESLVRRYRMTAREADVALLLARGARNAAIASELRISPHTARHHTENVLAKLHVGARAEVARVIAGGARAKGPSD
jgi:DNA-binding CsgD family transcriptional regulator